MAAVAKARQIGSEPCEELIAAGTVDEETLARAFADALGLPFALPSARDRVVWRSDGLDVRLLRTCTPDLKSKLFIAPRLQTIDRTARWLQANGTDGIVVTTARALRGHEAEFSTQARCLAARFRLTTERPQWSARTVLTAPQAYALGLATCALLLAIVMLGSVLWTGLHVVVSLFLFACTAFRLLVFFDYRRRAARPQTRRDLGDGLRLPIEPLPVYTVLVALYREAGMAGPLIDSLAALNWPRSRLDVKLVCEADDAETIRAVRRHIEGRTGFEIVAVPPSLPRTKPKALNYALPLARGEFVVLYDAEDRPDPDQLLEAWLAFRANGPDLACVQAPLVIRNASGNWLAGAFAFEYAVLFRTILPFLARHRLPIPLGGTSNHFRRSALNRVGGWDSYNVAEDADLGIRLARCGYRTDVIQAPTSETAPERWIDWRNQRSRWVKGWIQTYLVHMRQPGRSFRELGALKMAVFQVLFLSMVTGAVMHTVFVMHLAAAFAALVAGRPIIVEATWLMAVDMFNIVATGLAFALLASLVLTPRERPLIHIAWSLWFYWLLVSWASLRALHQLFFDPHGWEKTPHGGPGDEASAGGCQPVVRAASSTSVTGRSSPSATSSCQAPSLSW